MKTQEIARHLLNRQNAGPLVFPGELIGAIGSDAVQEALQRRWLIPEHDSGMLKVNTDGAMVEDMRAVSDKCPTCQQAECACAPVTRQNESHDLAYTHALRQGGGSPLFELMTPGLGLSRDIDPGLKTPVPPTPTTPPRPPAPVAGGKPVGVATKTPEGKINLELGKDEEAKRVAQQIQTAR